MCDPQGSCSPSNPLPDVSRNSRFISLLTTGYVNGTPDKQGCLFILKEIL